ncbi:MucR family transcriptional regulator [Pseudochrobactrum kiredjianiae]|uniref:MucR family transcriptional regulator n=1 Tax=Pseudochrobactrum kiredjianiae TaxID=386305 RepID=A0ABW3V6B6_9HYPH|nr:MucR family transcriptional regulator [Pseudochrobactrum kiredjianiae]MDM7850680.1 MucR family transcriptional regulator [Pseudochrobactrum kiredjianiae]
MSNETSSKINSLVLTADVVSAFVANNSVSKDDLSTLILQVSDQFLALSNPILPVETIIEKPVPAVAVKKSYDSEVMTCLECGSQFKSLKRHLKSNHNLTPEEYRARWELPASYPMVAPAYAEKRSALAKTIGLGRKPGQSPKKAS